MNFLVYDCEIIRLIRNTKFYPNLKYCAGWNDFKNMGISVLGFRYQGNISYDVNIYNEIPWTSLINFKNALKTKPIIVGFNSRKFDDLLLQANGIEVRTHFDLLELIRTAAYGSPRWQEQPKGFCYSLATIAQANGIEKIESGELAPIWWQQGHYQAVIDYNLRDVEITSILLDKAINGSLIDPNTKKVLKIHLSD